MASFLDRIFPQATKANRAQALVDTSIGMGSISPRYKDYHSYLQAFKSPWVKACVSVIAYNAANVHYALRQGNDDDQEDAITTSPLLDLLAKPNKMQTGFQLLEAIFIDLELTGNSFLALEEQDGRGRPAELYRLSPDSVTVLPDPETMIAGYVYTVNGRSIKYLPDELLHLKYPNPLSDLYGMGTIEAGEARFDSELAMAEHERQFWRNGAKITGLLTMDGQVTDKVFQRLTDGVRNFFRNSGYSTMMLENGLKYQSVSDGPAKLGMLEMSKASRDMILAMFGVPPTKLGILENANYKAQASDEFFWTETVDPKLTRLEQELQRLVDLFHPGQNYRIAFDRLNFSDDLPTATVAEMLARTYSMTINELREYRGADPLPTGGDVILVPSTLVPLEQALAPPAPAPPQLRVLPDPAGVPEQAAKRLLRVGSAAPASAIVVTRRRDALFAAAERAHGPAIAAAFAAQERAVLDTLGTYKRRKAVLDPEAVGPDTEDAALAAALAALALAALQDAAETALLLDIAIPAGVPLPGATVAAAAVDAEFMALIDRAGAQVAGINQTTRQALQEQVREGLRRGYSVAQIADGVPTEGYKGIVGVFEEAKTFRTATIARTEAARAYNAAALLLYERSGRVREVQMIDGTAHEPCSSRNGQIISVDAAKSIHDHPNGTLCFVPLLAA